MSIQRRAKIAVWGALLVSAPCAASAQRWTFNRFTMERLAVPRAIRGLHVFDDLEYDDTSAVFGLAVDLNRDGHADYIIRSAESLCGNAGCEYLIVDGASGRELGTLFGGAVYVEPGLRGRFPVFHSLATLSAESATWTKFVYRNGKYAAAARRVFAGTQLDSMVPVSESHSVEPA